MWFPVLCCCVTTMLSQECLRNFPDFFCGYTKLSGCFLSPLGFLSFCHEQGGSNMSCSQTLTFSNWVCLSFQHPVPNLSLSGGKMQGRAPLSTSTQPISAHKVTAQKSVNTRRNSTPRSCVLLCGVSSESLGSCVEGRHSRRGWHCLLGRFHSCIATPLAESAAVDPLSWYLCHLHGPAFPGTIWQTHELQLQRTLCIRMRKKFWSNTKLKPCSLGEPKVANVSAVFVAHETHLSCTRVQLITDPWPSGDNPNTEPFGDICVRYCKDPKQVRSFQKLVLLSSCCQCLFWTSLSHFLNLHAFYRVSFTWCKTKIQQSDHSQQMGTLTQAHIS